MEVGVELKFSNGSGCIEWNFDKGSMYNGSVQWMTLPSHRTYDLFLLYSRTVHCMQATAHGLRALEDLVQVSVPSPFPLMCILVSSMYVCTFIVFN